ncbi:MAG TPA: hypothetical protein VL359_07155, partial [bacterium]|nr:hypothetical protein [bacterium]
PVAKIESVTKLEDQMRKGAVWAGEPASPGGLHCALKEWPAAVPPESAGWPQDWSPPVLPPLASKLYEESDLRVVRDRRMA